MPPLCALTVCAVLQGSPFVVDGDTLRIGGQSIRLFGIDAEERREANGPRATEALRQIVASSPYVRCHHNDTTSHKRVVAVCYTADGQDIGQTLVARGYVLDCERYSRGYYRQFEPQGVRSTLTAKGYCRSRLST